MPKCIFYTNSYFFEDAAFYYWRKQAYIRKNQWGCPSRASEKSSMPRCQGIVVALSVSESYNVCWERIIIIYIFCKNVLVTRPDVYLVMCRKAHFPMILCTSSIFHKSILFIYFFLSILCPLSQPYVTLLL